MSDRWLDESDEQLAERAYVASAGSSILPTAIQVEMTRRSIATSRELKTSIDRLAASGDRWSLRIFWLTVVLVILTAVLVALTVVLAVKH